MIGREEEQRELRDAADSPQSEFVAVYGRRRVGKTYLVRETFEGELAFVNTGIYGIDRKRQLQNFRESLEDAGDADCPVLKDWFAAFRRLGKFLARLPQRKKIVFLDELPWLDTPRSRFVPALEHFWNGWASARDDVLLVVAGSATTWIVERVLRSRGGLHNRVTKQMHLRPFSLAECERFAASRGLELDRIQLAEAWMALGGVPWYWRLLKPGRSVAQNLDALFFAPGGALHDEFARLFDSLFRADAPHLRVVESLARHRGGLDRDRISEETGIPSGGALTRMLEELEQCDFVRKFHEFGKKTKGARFQLCDPFTLFHFRFVRDAATGDERAWSESLDAPEHLAWEGMAFETLVLGHVAQIKRALGISGVRTSVCSWAFRGTREKTGAQIDLLVDREDRVIDLCEMKFCRKPYRLTKEDVTALENRRDVLKRETGTTKAVHFTLVAPEGVAPGAYAGRIQSVIRLADLFADA